MYRKGAAFEWELAVVVLQEYDPFFFNLLRHFKASKYINHLRARRIIYDARIELGSQNTMYHVIQPSLWHFAIFDSFFQRFTEERVAWHLDV
jgi:hypothetical protein